MKSFNYKALAAAAASACAASATMAGTVVAPATPVKFALEAVTNTTAVTIPNIAYQMGVGRQATQNFTFIVKVPSASTVFSGTCPTPTSNQPNMTFALKRASGSECAYDVTVANVANAVNVGDLINVANLTVNNHALGSGTNLSVVVNLADPGETSRVDNSADITANVATATQIVSLYASVLDTHTTADVNFNSGNSPLFGFVGGAGTVQTSTVNDDSVTTYANFGVNVAAGYVVANGTTAANASNTLTNVTLTVTGDFSGLVTNFANGTGSGKSAVTFNNGASQTAAVTYTANNASSTAVFTLTGAQLVATGSTPFQVALASTGTQSLGTARTFQVSGAANPTVNAAESIGTSASWWTWKANAIQLATAFFNNDTTNGNLTRFFFQNVGGAAAGYSATCYPESGVTVNYGTAKTGSLIAGTTAINASDICTFSTGKRGSIVFTVNSAVGKIKGVYQQAINGAAAGYIALERPYGNNGTSAGTNF